MAKKYHRFRKNKPKWGRTLRAKNNMAWALWRIRKKKRGEGTVLVWPPVIESLLVWLRGDSSSMQKLDTQIAPYAENFKMKGSHCIGPNGSDEWGDFDIETWDDGFIFETGITADSLAIARGFIGNKTNAAYYFRSGTDGTIRLSGSGGAVTTTITITAGLETHISFVRPDGGSTITVTITDETGVQTEDVTLAGTFLFNVLGRRSSDFWLGKFWDTNLNGVHFRIAEGLGDGTNLTSFSDDYENDGLTIAWTGIPATMWAQRQDSYHGNAVDGKGYRENQIMWSEDLDNPNWLKTGVTVDGNTITPTGGTNNELKTNNPDVLAGQEYTFALDIRADVEHTARLSLTQNEPPYTVYIHKVITVTPEWTEFYCTGITNTVKLLRDIYPDRDNGLLPIQVRNIRLVKGSDPGTHVETQDFTLSGDEYLPFLNDDKGGTFNDCETSYGPEEFPVGTFNGVDDAIGLAIGGLQATYDITLYARIDSLPSVNGNYGRILTTDGDAVRIYGNVGDDRLLYSHKNSSGGSTFVTVFSPIVVGDYFKLRIVADGTNLTAYINDVQVDQQSYDGTIFSNSVIQLGQAGNPFEGPLRDVNINGLLIPINEGSGTDIHDSDGNIVGTLAGDASFWEGEPMVSQAIGDAEAASTSGNYLTDGKYHALYMTQQAWGELGAELSSDVEFNTPSEWTLTGDVDISNSLCVMTRVASANTRVNNDNGELLEAGKTYRYTLDIIAHSGASVYTDTGSGFAMIAGEDELGLISADVLHDGGGRPLLILFSDGTVTMKIMSVREVNQVMNQNKQYYFCAEAGLFINKNVLTDAQHLEYIEFLYNNCYQEFEALIDEQSGSILYDEVSGSIIYDEEA